MSAFEGGFAAPVAEAQAAFRGLMEAMAQPGQIARLGQGLAPPAPVSPAAGAILLALADVETPVWFEGAEPAAPPAAPPAARGGAEPASPAGVGGAGAAPAAEWLRFHTGAPRAATPEAAAFVLLAAGSPVTGWARFAAGTAADPHLSATLILPVAALTGGAGLVLSGPGIDGVARIAPRGLPAGFAPAMAANAARFPLGFDLILTCGTGAIALPRTTRSAEG